MVSYHPTRAIRLFPLWTSICVCLWYPSSAVSELVVITTLETPVESVSPAELKKRWLGETKLIRQSRVEVVDLDEGNSIRYEFYDQVLGVSKRQLKAHWAKRVFRGNGFPPRMLENDTTVMDWVAASPNRIGYIDSQNLKPGFKVLFRDTSGGSDNGQK
jgi:hypothetical protein